jgi:hypothetical protein
MCFGNYHMKMKGKSKMYKYNSLRDRLYRIKIATEKAESQHVSYMRWHDSGDLVQAERQQKYDTFEQAWQRAVTAGHVAYPKLPNSAALV